MASAKENSVEVVVISTRDEMHDSEIPVGKPVLTENEESDLKEAMEIITAGCDLHWLKWRHCQVYLKKHGIRVTDRKEVLIDRVNEHIEFDQFNRRKRTHLGSRTVVGRVTNQSYGLMNHQHTVTFQVLWSSGMRPLSPLQSLRFKGKDFCSIRLFRQPWADEEKRERISKMRQIEAMTALTPAERLKEKCLNQGTISGRSGGHRGKMAKDCADAKSVLPEEQRTEGKEPNQEAMDSSRSILMMPTAAQAYKVESASLKQISIDENGLCHSYSPRTNINGLETCKGEVICGGILKTDVCTMPVERDEGGTSLKLDKPDLSHVKLVMEDRSDSMQILKTVSLVGVVEKHQELHSSEEMEKGKGSIKPFAEGMELSNFQASGKELDSCLVENGVNDKWVITSFPIKAEGSCKNMSSDDLMVRDSDIGPSGYTDSILNTLEGHNNNKASMFGHQIDAISVMGVSIKGVDETLAKECSDLKLKSEGIVEDFHAPKMLVPSLSGTRNFQPVDNGMHQISTVDTSVLKGLKKREQSGDKKQAARLSESISGGVKSHMGEAKSNSIYISDSHTNCSTSPIRSREKCLSLRDLCERSTPRIYGEVTEKGNHGSSKKWDAKLDSSAVDADRDARWGAIQDAKQYAEWESKFDAKWDSEWNANVNAGRDANRDAKRVANWDANTDAKKNAIKDDKWDSKRDAGRDIKKNATRDDKKDAKLDAKRDAGRDTIRDAKKNATRDDKKDATRDSKWDVKRDAKWGTIQDAKWYAEWESKFDAKWDSKWNANVNAGRDADRDAKRVANWDANTDAKKNAIKDDKWDSKRDASRDTKKNATRDDKKDAKLDAERDDKWDAKRDAGRDTERDAKKNPTRDDKKDAKRDAGRDTERDAKKNATRDDKKDATRDATRDSKWDVKRDDKRDAKWGAIQDAKWYAEWESKFDAKWDSKWNANVNAGRNADRDAKRVANWDAETDANTDAIKNAIRDDKWDSKRDASRDTKKNATRDDKKDAKRDAKWDDKWDSKKNATRDDKKDAKWNVKWDAKRDGKHARMDAKQDVERQSRRDASQDAKWDAYWDPNRDAYHDARWDTNPNVPLDANGMLKWMPNEMPIRMPNEMPIMMPNDMPIRMPNEMPIVMPNEIPIGMPNSMPIGMPNGIPIWMPNGMPIWNHDARWQADWNDDHDTKWNANRDTNQYRKRKADWLDLKHNIGKSHVKVGAGKGKKRQEADTTMNAKNIPHSVLTPAQEPEKKFQGNTSGHEKENETLPTVNSLSLPQDQKKQTQTEYGSQSQDRSEKLTMAPPPNLNSSSLPLLSEENKKQMKRNYDSQSEYQSMKSVMASLSMANINSKKQKRQKQIEHGSIQSQDESEKSATTPSPKFKSMKKMKQISRENDSQSQDQSGKLAMVPPNPKDISKKKKNQMQRENDSRSQDQIGNSTVAPGKAKVKSKKKKNQIERENGENQSEILAMVPPNSKVNSKKGKKQMQQRKNGSENQDESGKLGMAPPNPKVNSKNKKKQMQKENCLVSQDQSGKSDMAAPCSIHSAHENQQKKGYQEKNSLHGQEEVQLNSKSLYCKLGCLSLGAKNCINNCCQKCCKKFKGQCPRHKKREPEKNPVT